MDIQFATLQKRIADVVHEIDDKQEKIVAFQHSDLFALLPWRDQELLQTQLHIMQIYRHLLD